MYQIKTDDEHTIISLVIQGETPLDEMRLFVTELEKVTLSYRGREIKIMADMRAFKPTSAVVAEQLQKVQEFGLNNGVVRVAEIVASAAVATQLNIVAKRSHTAQVLRRFPPTALAAARQWLITGQAPE
jgi:hypothetical protein